MSTYKEDKEKSDLGASEVSKSEGANNKHAIGGLRTVENGYAVEEVVVEHDRHETSRILRKVDYRLIPFLSLIYLVSFIDRANIGNALIAGMQEDLDLKGMDYNIALSVFFVSYALLEVPSNVVLKLMSPRKWIAIIMFTWGTVLTLQGIVTSKQGLYAARFFLGFSEAGLFPAATYLLTLWYRRYELQRRLSIFYCAASLAGAFSGLLAYGIQHMAGTAGLGGWQWIFILEGLVTVAMAPFVLFFLPDSPETARFLTTAEKEFLINRLAYDTDSGQGRTTNHDKVSWKHVKAALMEVKLWASILIFLACNVGTYAFTAIAPRVVRGLGYQAATAQLMTVPIYAAACVVCVTFAFWSDKIKKRMPFVFAAFGTACVGLIGQLAIPQTRLYGLTYFFLFPIAAGVFSAPTFIIALTANNLAPSSKRAVGLGLILSFSALGGICGSNIFILSQAPKFPTGFGTALGMEVAAIISAIVLRRMLLSENKKRDEFMADKTVDDVKAMYTEEELLDLGDRSPLFRYTL